MLMTLHHQQTTNLPDGTTVNVGEDGMPYADDGLLIVADGLGGRGGYPHANVNNDILDEQRFRDKILGEFFPQADEEFIAFVQRSLTELFQLKDRYLDNADCQRTSGYFASRLVTAIVLYEFKFGKQFNRERLFERARESDESDRAQLLANLGDELAQAVRDKLGKLAKRMGLGLESKIVGSYLLPSTLVAALVDEREQDADVLYFWAGDSRCYLWNANGLAQMTDDHERFETMTNLVSLTKPFTIEARFVTVGKPFVLFNATDGCYKCPCFGSPIDLEYLMLQEFAEADSFEQASQLLDEYINVIGSHDDSNTMALATFGYADYADFRQAVHARIDDIDSAYKSRMADIFDRDYAREADDVRMEARKQLSAIRSVVLGTEADKQLAISLTKSMYPDAYEDKLAIARAEVDARQRERKAKVTEWVKRHWLHAPALRDHSDVRTRKFGSSPCKDYGKWEGQVQTLKKNCVEQLGKLSKMLDPHTDCCGGEGAEQINDACLTDGKRVLHILKSKFKGIFGRAKTIARKETKLNEWNARYLAQDAEAIAAFADKLLSGEDLLSGISMSDKCRAEIDGYVEGSADDEKAKREIEQQAVASEESCLRELLEDKADEIVPALAETNGISDELKAQTTEYAKLSQQLADLKQLLDRREELYAEYAKQYYRFLEESKLS